MATSITLQTRRGFWWHARALLAFIRSTFRSGVHHYVDALTVCSNCCAVPLAAGVSTEDFISSGGWLA